MKFFLTCLLLIGTLNLVAQIPISHDPSVSFTFSGTYYAAGGNATNNFAMCDSWNSGTYGGWLQMDLNTTINLESLRWWVGMLPNGNVASELVEVSADGTNWTLAANTSGWHYVFQEINLSFDPVIPNVRYIRISQSGTPSWFSILEMIVNEPYYADNIYTNLAPKILDSLGNELTDPISNFPYKYKCSKADSYQWCLDAVPLPGETSQEFIAPAAGNYACAVTYGPANCGFATTSEPTPLAPLPTELNAFTASVRDDNALLNWQVASLINASHFEIQRSEDGSNFRTIGIVTSEDIGNYFFEDVKPPIGINYYRLKMVDIDGTFDFSDIRWLRFANGELSVYPNPATDVLTIRTDQDSYQFFIYDVLGAIFYKGKSSEKNRELDLLGFPPGIYCLVIDHPTKGDKIKFVVK